jgi:hypothetical protein
MSDPLFGGENRCDSVQERERSKTTNGSGNFSIRDRVRRDEFAGLCGLAFCIATSAELLENSHFFTTEAITTEASEKHRRVNRSHKGDRLPVGTIDSWTGSAHQQGSIGTPEVGDPPSARITIRDADGRPSFELDPLRRTTVISKTRVS